MFSTIELWASLSVSRTGSTQIDSLPKLFVSFYNRYGSNPQIRCCSGNRSYLTEWGRIVAILIRLVEDFDLAEEAAQETTLPGTSDYVKFSPNIFTFNSTDGGFRDG